MRVDGPECVRVLALEELPEPIRKHSIASLRTQDDQRSNRSVWCHQVSKIFETDPTAVGSGGDYCAVIVAVGQGLVGGREARAWMHGWMDRAGLPGKGGSHPRAQ